MSPREQTGPTLRGSGTWMTEQCFLFSQRSGDTLVFLGDLQRVHGSGAVSEAVLNGYLRRMEVQFARLQELVDQEAVCAGESHTVEKRHLQRTMQQLRRWAVRAEDRVQRLPSGIGSDGAHPQVRIQEFSRDVGPLLGSCRRRCRRRGGTSSVSWRGGSTRWPGS